jgi:hypothetical protein
MSSVAFALLKPKECSALPVQGAQNEEERERRKA